MNTFFAKHLICKHYYLNKFEKIVYPLHGSQRDFVKASRYTCVTVVDT